MRALLGRRHARLAVAMIVVAAVTSGIAYAAIPDGGGVFNACVLKNVGTIRLIDTSKSGLQGHCSNVETEVTWNQQGQPGAAGAPGAKGDKGDPGAAGAPGAKGDK